MFIYTWGKESSGLRSRQLHCRMLYDLPPPTLPHSVLPALASPAGSKAFLDRLEQWLPPPTITESNAHKRLQTVQDECRVRVPSPFGVWHGALQRNHSIWKVHT
jgi:hypothetical protein